MLRKRGGIAVVCSPEQRVPKREWVEVSRNAAAHRQTGRIRYFKAEGHIIRKDIGRICTCTVKKEQSNGERDRYLE